MKTSTLLHQGLLHTLSHFMERTLSIVCCIMTILFAVILYHYNPMDASWNTASDIAIHHPFGIFGSFIADFFMQIFGGVSYFFIGFGGNYAVRLWRLKPLSLVLRPFMFMVGLILFCMGSLLFSETFSGSLPRLLWTCYIVPVASHSISPYFLAYVLAPLHLLCLMAGISIILFALYVPLSVFTQPSSVLRARGARLFYILYGLFKFAGPLLKSILPWGQSIVQKIVPGHLHPMPKSIRDFIQKPFFQKTHSKHYEEPIIFNDPKIDSDPKIEGEPPVKEQLSLFKEEAFEEEEENESVDEGASSENNDKNAAIAHFKEWLRDKKKKTDHQKSMSVKKVHDLVSAASIGGFELPAIDLLDIQHAKRIVVEDDLLKQYADNLEQVLSEFGVKGEIVNIRPGPVVTMYELMPAPGIKSSRVIGLAEDIARSMCALSARIAVIPGKNVMGIELPNPQREMVYLRDLLQSEIFQKGSGHLRLILGKDIGGNPSIADLAKMPHLLVAGTTGSGKSVAVNTMILSLLYQYTPDQCKFIMIDPKMLELSIYNDIPHLLTPVVTDPKKAVVALKWAVKEMENRYRAMSKMGVRNIDGFNTRVKEASASGEMLTRKVQTGFDGDSGKPVFETQPIDLTPLPYIVVVVDEMADLMLVAGKEIEAAVQRLAQMARAAGIHLIMATQRPSVDVITGTIKANFPTRISFQVTSKIDSRTILGEQGAEQLLGQGDMLYMAGGGRIHRVHGPFVKDEEVERIVSFLKTQGEPSYIESVTQDDEEESASGNAEASSDGRDQLYDNAVTLVLREGKASTSFVQRHLQIGYNRAARIIDLMEKDGVITAANHVGKREVIGRTG